MGNFEEKMSFVGNKPETEVMHMSSSWHGVRMMKEPKSPHQKKHQILNCFAFAAKAVRL